MSGRQMRFGMVRQQWSWMACGAAVWITASTAIAADAADNQRAEVRNRTAIDGRELFTREWIPGDPRSHGGDGLGPMFNESSCVACHNLGGVGGGGPASKNVHIMTAFNNRQFQQATTRRRIPQTLPEQLFRSLFGDLDEGVEQPATKTDPAETPEQRANRERKQLELNRKELARLHPGFEGSTSLVLHRDATYAGYQTWRTQLNGFNFSINTIPNNDIQFFSSGASHVPVENKGTTRHQGAQLMQQLKADVQMSMQRRMHSPAVQHGNFAIVRSERNTTALFGAGFIDAIPVAVLEEMERSQAANGKVSGRIARLDKGLAGRFGWKSQIPSLEEFVLTACAVELGLNVPDHPQAGLPHKPDYTVAGLDLNREECNALIGYLRELPAPVQRNLEHPHDRTYIQSGEQLFTQVGCAECHVPNVGEVAGVYSDLLLHDMGPELGDSGSSYGVFVPNSTPEGHEAPLPDLADQHRQQQPTAKLVGATRQEWRTPPLWGVRDSAPYLHDGRAESLEQAIAFHAGEAQPSAAQFFNLSDGDRFRVIAFLKSLIAPEIETQTAAK